jgi:hypothetical protein
MTALPMDWSSGVPVQTMCLSYRLPVMFLTSLFAFMSAAGHFYILRNWQRYEEELRRNTQRIRWQEYQFSAALIITLLFILWSNLDVFHVTGCFVTAMMNIQFGDTHELLNSGRKHVTWKSFWYGAYMGILPWIVMWGEVARILVKYEVPLNLIPWWVWAFLAEYWLLFWCFPINLAL